MFLGRQVNGQPIKLDGRVSLNDIVGLVRYLADMLEV